VPHHGSRDIAPPLLRKILHDIDATADDFLAALRS
jgi:predicted RNA binding protein YcfA (HicA-like mRNA interferase family)